MPVLPVIAREMRASARQPFTFHLRTIGASLLVASSVMFGLNFGFRPDLGARLFATLHFSLLLAIWIFVPLLTADCLSRERREGTLGLLFLTPLRPGELVVAKSFANGLRALSLLLAVIPVLMIPFLLGGTTWLEAVLSVAINLSAVAWALAAGLLASAWSKVWLRALFGALSLATVFLLGLSIVVGLLMMFAFTAGGVGRLQYSADFALLTGLGVLCNTGERWGDYLRLGSAGQFLWVGAQFFLISLIGLTGVIALVGWRIRRSWKEEPPSLRRQRLEATLLTPVVGVGFLRRHMRRTLERNPVGWLEQRTWTGRLVTWGWLAIVVTFYTFMFARRTFGPYYVYSAAQVVMAWLLIGGMAISAAGSFRRERETGVLELLLVSPLRESRIISGRLAGLWLQFLPAFGALVILWVYLGSIFPHFSNVSVIPFYVNTFLTLPVIGLFFSLASRSFLNALLSTIAVAIIVPVIVAPLYTLLLRPLAAPSFQLSGRTCLVQLLLAVVFWFRLHARLKQRQFALEKPGP